MFGNQLSLGVVVSLRDAFSAPAAKISRGFYSLDDAAYRSQRGINRALGAYNRGIADITRTLAAAAAIGGALAVPIAMSAKFTKGLTEIKGIADQTTFNMAELRKEILKQSQMFGQDPYRQVEATYEAVSSGFLNTRDAAIVTGEAAKDAVTELTDVDTALSGLVSVMNAYKLSASSATSVSDKLFTTIQLGRVRGDELAKSIGMLAPIAASARVPLEQMLGMYSSLTLSGLSPSQSAMYLRQVIMGLEKPTAQSKKAAAALGVGIGASEIQRRHGDIASLLIDAWEASGRGKKMELFQRFFGGKQSWNAIAALITQDNGKLMLEHIRKHNDTLVVDDFGVPMSARERAFQLQRQTFDQTRKEFVAGMKVLGINIGHAAEIGVTPFLRGITTIVNGVNALIARFPILTKVIYAFLASLSAALVMFAYVQKRNLFMNGMFRNLVASMNMATFRFGAMTLTMKTIIPTLMGVVGIFALAGYVFRRAVVENWNGFGDWIRQKVLLIRALAYGVTHMDGVFAQIPEELGDALKKAGILEQYEYWIRILARVRFFFESMFLGAKFQLEDLGRRVRHFGFTLVRFLSGVGLNSFANKIRAFMASFHIESSDMKLWREIGFAVGKILTTLVSIWVISKTWRALWLVMYGGWKIATLPFVTLRRAVSGVTSAFSATVSAARAIGNAFSFAFQRANVFYRLLRLQSLPGRRALAGLGQRILAYGREHPTIFGRLLEERRISRAMRLSDAATIPEGFVDPLAVRMRAIRSAPGRFLRFLGGLPGRALGGLRALPGRLMGGLRGAGGFMQGLGQQGLAAMSAGMKGIGAAAGAARAGVMTFFTALRGGLMSTMMFFVTNPIGLAILGIVAAVALLWWKWDWFKAKFKALWGWFRGLVSKAPMWLQIAFPIIAIAKHWDTFKTKAVNAFHAIMEKIRPFLKLLGKLTDFLGITNGGENMAFANPFNTDPMLGFHGALTSQMALKQFEHYRDFVAQWKGAFQDGTLNDENARTFVAAYRLQLALAKQLPKVGGNQTGVENYLNAHPAIQLTGQALTRLHQVSDEILDDENAYKRDNEGDDTRSTSYQRAVADGIEKGAKAGSEAGVRKGLQEVMTSPRWSGDKWLQNGMSPFINAERNFARAAGVRDALGGETMATELGDLKEHVKELGQGLAALAGMGVHLPVHLDGKKIADHVFPMFKGKARTDTIRGVGGQ